MFLHLKVVRESVLSGITFQAEGLA